MAAQSSVQLLAIDGDPAGNSPRTVAGIQECVSADVGELVTVDVVVPDPGIPTQRGIAAYQFSLLYDPEVVWVQADDGSKLLDQAAGSNVVPITDPKPDRNGVYLSWAVDFGPSGIEPTGSSETGPGVLARLSLLPQRSGTSTLTLSGPLIIDDNSQRIPLEAVRPATIQVGRTCPGDGQSATGSQPTPSPSAAAPQGPDAAETTADPAAATDQADRTRSLSASAGEVPAAGGPPPVGAAADLPVAAGAAMCLTGAAMLIGGMKGRTQRRRASSFRDRGQ